MTSTSAAHVAPRRAGGIAADLAGLAALVALILLPAPAPITELGMARLGLLAFAVIWWIAAPFPLAFTTLAMLAIGILTGALTVNSAFAHSSSWVLWFVVGAFGMAAALEATGVNRRFALAFLDITWVRGHPHRFLLMFGPSLDYLLPSGTTTNAIVAGSGFLRVKTMVRYGAILFVIHTLLLAYVGYPLSKFVLGR